MARWAIVGGGMLGSTLALRLAQAGHQVTLFEAAGELGGLASAWTLGDVVWDRHYHVTLLSDSYNRALLSELELEAEMEWVETRTGSYFDGRLHSVSNIIEFLRFPPLSLIDKLRLAATIFYGSRVRNWKRLEQIPVGDWLQRLSGRRVFHRFWLPLLEAKLGDAHHETSAAFIWATIQRLYAARRTGLKKEMFGYVPGGYARILAKLAATLEAAGVEIRLSARVTSVGAGPTVSTEDHGHELFDRVVVTTAAPVARRMIQGLSPSDYRLLEGVRYQGIVCASMLTQKPLSDYYLTYLHDPAPFTAVIEMSAFVDPQQFGENSLVYLPKYVAPGDPLFESSDETIRTEFLSTLEEMYPHFNAHDVLAFRVSRVRNVFALSSLDYSSRVPPQDTSLHGVHLICSAHILNGTLNVNETLELAEGAARRLIALERSTVEVME